MPALKLAPAANFAMATVFYGTPRVLVVVLLGGCVAAMPANVPRGSVVSADRIFAAIVARHHRHPGTRGHHAAAGA